MESSNPVMDFLHGALIGTLSTEPKEVCYGSFYDLGLSAGCLASKTEDSLWLFRRGLAKALADYWDSLQDKPVETFVVEQPDVNNCMKCIEALQKTIHHLGGQLGNLEKEVKANDTFFADGEEISVKKERKEVKMGPKFRAIPDNVKGLIQQVKDGTMKMRDAAMECGMSVQLFRYYLNRKIPV